MPKLICANIDITKGIQKSIPLPYLTSMIADLSLSHLVGFSKNSAPGWTSLWTYSAFKIELLIRDTNQFVGNLQSRPRSRENGPLCPSPSQDHSSWMKSSMAGFSPYLCWRRLTKLFVDGPRLWSHCCQSASIRMVPLWPKEHGK